MTLGPHHTAVGIVVRLNNNWLVPRYLEPVICRIAGKRCCHSYCKTVRYRTDNCFQDCSAGSCKTCNLLGDCSVCYKMSNLVGNCLVDHCREPGSDNNAETRLLDNRMMPDYFVQLDSLLRWSC